MKKREQRGTNCQARKKSLNSNIDWDIPEGPSGTQDETLIISDTCMPLNTKQASPDFFFGLKEKEWFLSDSIKMAPTFPLKPLFRIVSFSLRQPVWVICGRNEEKVSFSPLEKKKKSSTSLTTKVQKF